MVDAALLEIATRGRGEPGVSRASRGLAVVVGTGLGAGFSPLAPGTVGSAVGVALFIPLAAPGLPAVAVAVALLLPVGVWSAAVCGERYGAHDHGRIVVDEIVGQLIALASFPANPMWLLSGFLLFRLFDIWKPFPARLIDRRWRTPFGVVADDVVAGVYANLVLQAFRASQGA
jgi:phosphatidylglycerophosphatase A